MMVVYIQELFYRRLYSISLFSFTLMVASIDGALNNIGLPLFFKSSGVRFAIEWVRFALAMFW